MRLGLGFFAVAFALVLTGRSAGDDPTKPIPWFHMDSKAKAAQSAGPLADASAPVVVSPVG